MALFLWDYHEHSTKFPESGFRMQLGNSYMATAAPVAPDVRIFSLDFTSMKYYQFSDKSIDVSTNIPLNFGALEAFYMQHKLHLDFDYMHPVYGLLSCKFNKPLDIPKAMYQGDGWLKPFSLELIETPTRMTQPDWFTDTLTVEYIPFV